MKAYLTDPLAVLGLKLGYTRPLDRHDFPHGSIPDRAGLFIPGTGEMRRHANISALLGTGAVAVDTLSFTSDQKHPLGTVAVDRCGRVFRYTQAGGVDIVPGKLYQSAVAIPFHLALTAVAEAIGAGSQTDPIVVTPGATGGAANLYAEGTLVISDGTGVGYCYRVSGHPAITASVAFNLYLDPDDRIAVALDSTSRYGLIHNPWKNVLVTPTTNTGLIIGVGVSLLTTVYYGWVQSRGPAAVLINGTPSVTAPVANSVTTIGAVDIWTTAAAAVAVTPVGRMMQTGVSTKYNQVFLTID